MSIWLFGKSSEFSQHMASQWKEDGHDVNEFGRSDVNYADPEKFIAMVSKLTIPNYVVFNINVGVPFECSPNLGAGTRKVPGLSDNLGIILWCSIEPSSLSSISTKTFRSITCLSVFNSDIS